MAYYVYIIYSEQYDKYYKGFSLNPNKRLEKHNAGESRYTSKFMPWKLVYLQSFETKKEALRREKGLKKYSKQQIRNLCASGLNEF